MKKRNHRLYTLILAPNDARKVRQYRISLYTVYGVVFGLILVSLTFSFAFFRYFYAVSRLNNYDGVVAELNAVKEENAIYKDRTASLTERVNQVEMVAKNISRLTGVEYDNPESTAGGVGGFTNRLTSPESADERSLDRLNTMGSTVGDVEKKIIRLKNETFERNLFLSSLPSQWPVRGYISSPFGGRADPFSGSSAFHTGMDISAPVGAKVTAPADGTVMFAGVQTGYGYIVIISHRYGITTRFAHLSSYSVRPGQSIRKNDVLGSVGSTGRSTGPHLHYEVHVNERPVNPMRFIRGERRS